MNVIDRSGVFFVALLIVFLGTIGIIFVGHAVVDPGFWIILISFVPVIMMLTIMRKPIGKLDRVQRFISWFSMGVTAAVWTVMIRGLDFILLDFVWCGAVLAVGDLIGEKIFPKNETE